MSRPMLALLDKYSPEYNCLLRGIAAYKPILIKTFEGGRVKQYIEFPTTQRRGYDQRDFPEYEDTRGPTCYGLPDNPPVPWPGIDLRNGTDLDSGAGRATPTSRRRRARPDLPRGPHRAAHRQRRRRHRPERTGRPAHDHAVLAARSGQPRLDPHACRR